MTTPAKHRAPSRRSRAREPWHLVGGLALAVTGVTVAGGVLAGGGAAVGGAGADGGGPAATTSTSGAASLAAARIAGRAESVTRSNRRVAGEAPGESEQPQPAPSRDAQKVALLSAGPGVVTTHERTLSEEDPRDVARALLGEFGFAGSQFSCLDRLWSKESGWLVDADNPTSSAYGIPQALPGSKMASAGADWETNPTTQIRWGLGYVKGRYGTPCAAWSHSRATGWY